MVTQLRTAFFGMAELVDPILDPHCHLGQRQAWRADPLNDVLRDLCGRAYAGTAGRACWTIEHADASGIAKAGATRWRTDLGASPPANDAGSPDHRRCLAAPTAYRRNAARTAAAAELKYTGGSMKPHSLKAEPLVRARR